MAKLPKDVLHIQYNHPKHYLFIEVEKKNPKVCTEDGNKKHKQKTKSQIAKAILGISKEQ